MPVDALISSTIPALVNGVSQQPHENRLTSQNQAQVNCLSDIVDGVGKRPPFEFIARLIDAGDVPANAFFHLINRDEDEQYILVIGDEEIRVFDLTGVEKDITLPDGVLYLNSSNPREDFVALTVADYTFIVNKTVVVELDSPLTASRPIEFIWTARTSTLTSPTIITIGATAVSSGAFPDNGVQVNLNAGAMVGTMLAALQANGTLSAAGWTFTQIAGGGSIYGVKASGPAPSAITAQDPTGNSGTNILGSRMAYLSVQRFTDLPARGEDGFVVEVKGDDLNQFDSFYVRWSDAENTWEECANPGDDTPFDPATMIHTLVRTPGGPDDFEFSEGDWAARAAGDTVTAPDPTFVGRTIRDVVIHADRLMVLTDENVVTSEATGYFNFWPTTVTTAVDSDPIDAAATSNRVTILDYAVPFQRELTVISAGADYQGELVGGDRQRLTPSNARIEERGAYAVSPDCRPVAANNSIFLPIARGRFTGITEYTIADDVAVADENTAHVPNFIPGSAFRFAVAPLEGVLIALTDAEPSRLYVYRWFSQGANRLMSSWSFWELELDAVVHFAEFIQSTLYVIVERADGLHLESLDLSRTATGDLSHQVHLDSLVLVTGTYASGTDLTTWALPYDQTLIPGEYAAVTVDDAFGDEMAELVPGLDDSVAEEVSAVGDFSAGLVAIGRTYDDALDLTQFHIRETTQTANRPVTGGRLQVRRARALLKQTGAVFIEVRLDGDEDVYEYPYTALAVDLSELGPLDPTDDQLEFDVGGENRHVQIRLTSRGSFLPWFVTGIEWEGYYFRRSDRV